MRTRDLLVGARLLFIFAHGALMVSASLATFGEDHPSWWDIFIPVWLGDVLCAGMIVSSWFASCPYIKLCLSEHQARFPTPMGFPGEEVNPSILTEILPDIVMAIFGLIFVALSLLAEYMLCEYLDLGERGEPRSLAPTGMVFIVVSLLATCRGVLMRGGSLFAIVGAAVLVTIIAWLCMDKEQVGFVDVGWVLVLPALASSVGLLASAAWRLRRCKKVLSPAEQWLRVAEQVVLAVVLLAMLALLLVLASGRGNRRRGHWSVAAAAGVTAGSGVCMVASLRGMMAVLESRLSPVYDRMVALGAAEPGFYERMRSLGASDPGDYSSDEHPRPVDTPVQRPMSPANPNASVASVGGSKAGPRVNVLLMPTPPPPGMLDQDRDLPPELLVDRQVSDPPAMTSPGVSQ